MSTKIWTAWRFPERRLNEFLDLVRPQMFAAVVRKVETLMESVRPEAVAQERAKRYTCGVQAGITEERIERLIRCEKVLALVKEAREKDVWQLTLDCGLSVWLYQRRAYVIPWGAPMFYEHLTLPDWAEDYAYWNSTDRPNTISERAWSARARTWDKAALDDWDAHRLTYHVIDMDRGSLDWGRLALHFMKPVETPAPTEVPA